MLRNNETLESEDRMARVEITKEQTVCDRYGSKVTASGARMQIGVSPAGAVVGPMLAASDESAADLCGGCRKSLEKWWNRKAGGE